MNKIRMEKSKVTSEVSYKLFIFNNLVNDHPENKNILLAVRSLTLGSFNYPIRCVP